jgi:FkbM family methyltransferase
LKAHPLKAFASEVEFPPELAKRLAGSPIRLVDVGARGGIERPWNAIAPLVEVVGFEPSEKAFEALLRTAPPNATYLNIALGDQSGEATFYNTRGPAVASLYKPNASFLEAFEKDEGFEVLGTGVCRVDTIDHVLTEAGIERVDFVKLDTQGSELSILRGAAETLDRFVFGVETEVSFNHIYEHQPLFGDVDAFLRRYDYELFTLTAQWRQRYAGRGLVDRGRGQTVWGDALYLKKPAAAAERLAGLVGEEREVETLKFVAICLIYGLGDYALELIAAAELPGLRGRQLAEAVRRYDELAAACLGVEYTFALPPEVASQLHEVVRRDGQRERYRTPEWVAVRAVRRWLKKHAPPTTAERIAALPGRVRGAARGVKKT